MHLANGDLPRLKETAELACADANLSETAEQRKESKLREENQRLKEALADRSLELDFFKGALRRIKEGRPNNTGSGASACTPKSKRGRSGKAN